jgi:sarcosine oxidase delta subunit
LEPKLEQYIFTGVAANLKAWKHLNTCSNHIQTSRNIVFDDIDNTIHPAPEADDEDDLPVPKSVPAPINPARTKHCPCTGFHC